MGEKLTNVINEKEWKLKKNELYWIFNQHSKMTIFNIHFRLLLNGLKFGVHWLDPCMVRSNTQIIFIFNLFLYLLIILLLLIASVIEDGRNGTYAMTKNMNHSLYGAYTKNSFVCRIICFFSHLNEMKCTNPDLYRSFVERFWCIK